MNDDQFKLRCSHHYNHTHFERNDDERRDTTLLETLAAALFLAAVMRGLLIWEYRIDEDFTDITVRFFGFAFLFVAIVLTSSLWLNLNQPTLCN